MWTTKTRPTSVLLLCGALLAAACGKGDVQEDFSALAGLDEKSDAFSWRMRVMGTLRYGQTSASVRYSNPPRFRAFKFAGRRDDAIKVWVRSRTGDAVTWVTDARFNTIGYNDDAPGTVDSLVQTRLRSTGDHYIIFRDYSLIPGSFTVELVGPSPTDFFSCTRDSDCEKTHQGCCPLNSWIAVRSGASDAYHRSLGCEANPICPRIAVRADSSVPVCEERRCKLLKPEQIICAGFRLPNVRACPEGYQCAAVEGDPRVDFPSSCYKPCGGIAAFTCEEGYQCVDRPYDDCDPENGGADCPALCVPPRDCRSTGCREGTSCAPCWGSYACLPPGAVC
jgi:hypothetical protein